MTIVENIRWSELLNNPIVTARHGNDGNRIATTTESLKKTGHQFAELLNERARLLANSAQFDAALRDATAIRALLPRSGIGYLCMGDVHCQLARHAAAISIYDQGLAAVPESDPYYHQIQQHRLTAVDSNDKRVDFITRLPLDIVITNILPRMEQPACLDSTVLYEPLHVSCSWQQRILQQSKRLAFAFGFAKTTFKTGHDQLIRFAPYVQTLRGSLLNVHLEDLFSRAHFSNLKELDILSVRSLTPRHPLVRGLQMVADSLTHLSVSGCFLLELGDILETCPNLVSLKTEFVDAITPLSSHYPKLKQLELREHVEQARTHDSMIHLLSRFPSLRILKIWPNPASTILPILHKHCPYLETVSLGCKSPDFFVTTTKGGKGITSAYFGGHKDYHQDDLLEFLYVHQNSLEIFDFRGKLKVNDALWKIAADGRVEPQSTSLPLGIDLSSPLSFLRLVDLRFTNMELSSGVPMTLWIVLNAPNLKAIHLPGSHIQPAVARAMIELDHLQKVHIEQGDTHGILVMEDAIVNDDILSIIDYDDMEALDYEIVDEEEYNAIDDNGDNINNNNNYDGIHQFFGYHASLRDRSTLEHVVVSMFYMDVNRQTWLLSISGLPRLKIFEVCGEDGYTDCYIDKNCVYALRMIRQECPALEKFIINGKCAPPERSHGRFTTTTSPSSLSSEV